MDNTEETKAKLAKVGTLRYWGVWAMLLLASVALLASALTTGRLC